MDTTAPTPQPSPPMAHVAAVVSLQDRRRARASRRRRSWVLRPFVAVWFGTALFAVAILVTGLVTVTLRYPSVGIPVAIAVASVCAWPLACRWIAVGDERAASRRR